MRQAAAQLVGLHAEIYETRDLVDAGFTPLEAIKIGTLNGATYEGRADHIGTIAVGKNADLVVVTGDPSKNINDIENTILIFKDGVAFDSQKLLPTLTLYSTAPPSPTPTPTPTPATSTDDDSTPPPTSATASTSAAPPSTW